MKFLRTLIVMFACCAVAHAETVKVFSQDLGQSTGQSSALMNNLGAIMNAEGVELDFGVFFGPKGTSYFKLTTEGWTFSNMICVQSLGGIHTYAWRTEKYEMLKRYAKVALGNGGVDGVVLQDLNTGVQYALVFPTGNQFSVAAQNKVSAYSAGIKTVATSILAEYPNAKLIVLTSYRWGTTYADLHTYLTSTAQTYYMNMDLVPFREASETDGGMYVQDPTGAVSGSTEHVAVEGNASSGNPYMIVSTLSWRSAYSVSFQDWDGTSLGDAQEVFGGADATPPADPEREGYDFTGWNPSYENISGNTTCVAQYDIKKFSVRFEDWDGTEIVTRTVDWDTDATPPADPTRDGYRFLGWQGTYTGVRDNVTIVATYAEASAATYWVTFEDWDGTELSRQEIVEGEDAVAPTGVEREGYDFDGWSAAYTNITANITVTALYTIKKFDVTFVDWDGTTLVVRSVDWNGTAVAPDEPTRTGYTFASWDAALSPITSACTITAQYTINSYTVRFLGENDEVLDTQSVEYLAAATAPATEPVSSLDNTVFWKWDADFSSITGNLDVNAVFTQAVVEVADVDAFLAAFTADTPHAQTIRLAANLDFTGVSVTKITEFYGTLDGADFEITGLQALAPLVQYFYGTARNIKFVDCGDAATYAAPGGFLADTSYGALFENLSFQNCHRFTRYTNGIYSLVVGSAGANPDTGALTKVSNCVVVGCSMKSDNANLGEMAMFVGCGVKLDISGCRVFNGEETESSLIGPFSCGGGIVGSALGNGSTVLVSRCYAEGSISTVSMGGGNNAGIGGMVGGSWGGGGSVMMISDCTNAMDLVGITGCGVGGILGRVCKSPAKIVRCVNYGSAKTETESGTTNQAGSGVGGILGGFWYGFSTITMTDCENFGDISATKRTFCGGIAGNMDGHNQNAAVYITNCMNHASVSSTFETENVTTNAVGGLIGRMEKVSPYYVNIGNNGAVSTKVGVAGGVVGEYSFYGNSATVNMRGVLSAGSASSESGSAGVFIGQLKTGPQSKNNFSLYSVILAANVEAGETAALLWGDRGNADTSTPVVTLDANSRILDTTLYLGATATGEETELAGDATAMTERELTGGAAVRCLNAASEEAPWVQGATSPELARWGHTVTKGSLILFF